MYCWHDSFFWTEPKSGEAKARSPSPCAAPDVNYRFKTGLDLHALR